MYFFNYILILFTIYKFITKADELVSLVNNIIINDKKDIDYIDGSNHSYEGKEELVAKQIIEFINK